MATSRQICRDVVVFLVFKYCFGMEFYNFSNNIHPNGHIGSPSG